MVVFVTIGDRDDVAVTEEDLVEDKDGVPVALIDGEGVVETVLDEETVDVTVDEARGDLEDVCEANGLAEAELDTELDLVPELDGVDVTERVVLAVDVGD